MPCQPVCGSHFLDNRRVAGPVKCGAAGQTVHHTCANDLETCYSAPKICSSPPKLSGLQRPEASPLDLAIATSGEETRVDVRYGGDGGHAGSGRGQDFDAAWARPAACPETISVQADRKLRDYHRFYAV
jgi:hypothetical protein